MRYPICLTFVLCSFFLNAQYHEDDIRRIFVGGDAGVSLLAIINQNNYGYSELDYEISTTPSFSIHAGLDLHTRHIIQGGVQYLRQGQKYKDVISGNVNEKEVNLHYIQVPLIYRFVLDKERGFAHKKLNKYVLGGFQGGMLLASNVDWYIQGQEVSMLAFINQTNSNANYDQIIADHGTNFEDKALFKSFDLQFLFGGGFQYFQTEDLMFYVELRGGVSLLDINADDWRYNNNKGVYEGSRNLFGGIRIGANYYFGKNGRGF